MKYIKFDRLWRQVDTVLSNTKQKRICKSQVVQTNSSFRVSLLPIINGITMEQMDIDVELSAKPGTSSMNAGPSAAGDSAGAKQQQPKGNIMAASGTIASVTISLHPLVIMNISEHWTRFRAQHGEPRQVYGALIGKQKGRNIEVMNSFELKTDEIADETIINKDYYNKKEQQYKQVIVYEKSL